MKKSDLELIGQQYRVITASKLSLYKLAEGMSGHGLDITQAGYAAMDGLDDLTDFQVGLMLASGWGMPVPDSWIARHVPIEVLPTADAVH